MPFVFKAWEDLTIQDDFMFKAVMYNVNSGIVRANPLVQALDKRVNEVKKSEEARLSYMTYELHLRDARMDGKAEGKAEGKMENLLENVRSLMSSLGCDAHRAMELLKVPEPVQKKILVQL